MAKREEKITMLQEALQEVKKRMRTADMDPGESVCLCIAWAQINESLVTELFAQLDEEQEAA